MQCTRANLTAEKGAADAAQAQAGAAADGFPTGTVIYLDVEAVSSVSQALESYVRAWAEALLEGGRYTPGLYAHARNAERLYAIMADAFARAGRTQRPRLWVATSQGFDLGRIPLESGFATAYIWQGLFDTPETYGGITLRIDANVADSANPSR
ncbi:MAG: glycoside hydrolase domain-containing protein [Longimicrobiales bacterium]